jgi:MFS-type transporter involved in bile tolerance (Atg22 family)
LPIAFLVIYGIFFSATGISQLLLNTLSGKLIIAYFRGRLALVSTVVGAAAAALFAWFLLRIWLPESPGTESQPANPNFAMIFFFTGASFVVASVISLTLRERRDGRTARRRTGIELLRSSMRVLKHDNNFRLLTIIAALFGMYLTLFPHYQALARGRLSLDLSALIPWVIAQNIGAALFSIPAGWIADKCGNRVVLRSIMLILCIAPALALVLAHAGAIGVPGFTIVFCLLGLTPITFRILNNYTLEVTDASQHPIYLSTLSLVMAGPAILTSSFFGALVDWVSFEFVFGIVIACIFCGWLLTFRLEEPRHNP